MENDVEVVTFEEKLEEFFENSIVCNIAKGLSITATVVFGVVAIVFGFVAMFAQPWHLYLFLFIVFGLIAGVCGGFFNYLIEEY